MFKIANGTNYWIKVECGFCRVWAVASNYGTINLDFNYQMTLITDDNAPKFTGYLLKRAIMKKMLISM